MSARSAIQAREQALEAAETELVAGSGGFSLGGLPHHPIIDCCSPHGVRARTTPTISGSTEPGSAAGGHNYPVSLALIIVDDHADFRGFVATMLRAEGFDVAGEVPDGESALAAIEALRPDVVLLDVQLPGIDGFEVASRIAALEHPPQVVLTSSRAATDFGGRVARSSACGFVPKDELSGAALTALLAPS